MLLLDAGFPAAALPATSGFPLSPLTLLAAGRTDFFMLSSPTLVHRQLALKTEEGRRKVKDVRTHSDSSNFPGKKNSFHQQKRGEKKKKSIITTPNSRKHLSVSVIKGFLTTFILEAGLRQQPGGSSPGVFTTGGRGPPRRGQTTSQVCLHQRALLFVIRNQL